jgi:glycine/D-amino acid oxidase-like deaminating enzyme
LRGLWKACQQQASQSKEGSSSIEWCLVEQHQDDTPSIQQRLELDFDVIVYCGGSGMFSKSTSDSSETSAFFTQGDFPVQLVRGQSLELILPRPQTAALLCGKYISPMPSHNNKALVGATHEFQDEPLSQEQVLAELKERTASLPFVWNGAVVERVTSAVRVQSARGPYGRRPIIGRLPWTGAGGNVNLTAFNSSNNNNNNAWVFTGLSSRGLLYHALYGDILANAILSDSESTLLEQCPDMLWWKK